MYLFIHKSPYTSETTDFINLVFSFVRFSTKNYIENHTLLAYIAKLQFPPLYPYTTPTKKGMESVQYNVGEFLAII